MPALAPASASPFAGLGGVRAFAGLGCGGGCGCGNQAVSGIAEIAKHPVTWLIVGIAVVAGVTLFRESR